MAAKTVTLFLMDGSPSGRMKCSLANWTGQVFLIPRTDLAKSTDRVELNQTGVYILLGVDDETGEERAYVGQARERKNGTGVLGRIFEHVRNGEHGEHGEPEEGIIFGPLEPGLSRSRVDKEKMFYFTHAIIIVTSNDSFGPTEISYLESTFYEQAQSAGRVALANRNTPSPGKVTEEKKAELDEFIDFAKIAIRSVGYRLFDSVDETPVSSASTMQESENVDPVLSLEGMGSTARGRQTDDGFVVLAGAELRPTVVPSAPRSVVAAREKFAERINESNELTKDTLFSSPSAAAGFLTGSSINGKVAWKNDIGKTLGELEQEELDLINRQPGLSQEPS